MKRWLIAVSLVLALSGIGASRLRARDNAAEAKIFGSMPNVTIRTIPAGGLPWVTDPGSKVEVGADGSVDVRIRGLLIAAGIGATGAPTPAALVGTDPVVNVRIAIVWAVPASAQAPAGIAIQESPVLHTDGAGNLTAHTTVGPLIAGDRPVIMVRATSADGTVNGPYIALSDFIAQFGSSRPGGED